MKKIYKIVIYSPETHSDLIRKAIGDAGAGKIGNYTHCSFSTKGVGRFTPTDDANPTIGEVGRPEQVQEERIEVVCAEEYLHGVLRAINDSHPYEEPATDIYLLESP